MTPRQLQLLEAIRQGACTGEAIAELAGLPYEQARVELAALKRSGHVSSEPAPTGTPGRPLLRYFIPRGDEPIELSVVEHTVLRAALPAGRWHSLGSVIVGTRYSQIVVNKTAQALAQRGLIYISRTGRSASILVPEAIGEQLDTWPGPIRRPPPALTPTKTSTAAELLAKHPGPLTAAQLAALVGCSKKIAKSALIAAGWTGGHWAPQRST